MSTRQPAAAGAFYPSGRGDLTIMVRRFLSVRPKRLGGDLRALIAPHAGYVYSGGVAGAAFAQLSLLPPGQTWRVVLLGPSHSVAFPGACLCASTEWLTPLGPVQVDKDARVFATGLLSVDEMPHLHEHCLEVELPFLQAALRDFTIVPLLTGECSPAALASELLPLLTEHTLLVVSSDLSHYLPDRAARKVDQVANEAIPALDIRRFAAEGDACGKCAILTLMEIARTLGWRGHLLDYRTSGDTSGDHGRVVGYGAYAFVS